MWLINTFFSVNTWYWLILLEGVPSLNRSNSVRVIRAKMQTSDFPHCSWMLSLLLLCPAIFWFFFFSLDCLSPLGMEDGRIKDTEIKATSYLNDTARPKYGRLNEKGGFGGWCSKRINRTGPFFTQYLQVNLNVMMRIRAITTQGREGGNERVERYRINYAPNRTDRYSWKWLNSESGLSKVRSVDMPGMFYLIIKTFIDFAL